MPAPRHNCTSVCSGDPSGRSGTDHACCPGTLAASHSPSAAAPPPLRLCAVPVQVRAKRPKRPKWCSVPTLQARETAHTRNRYGEPSVQADGVGSFGRPRTWAPATPVACKGPEPPRDGGRDKPGTHAAAILARVCGGGRQGWRLPNCKGAVPTDSANCSCAPSLLVGVWGAAARSGGDVCRAIGGAEALKNSVLLPLAFPRSTPIQVTLIITIILC